MRHRIALDGNRAEINMAATTECPLLLNNQPLIDALGYIDTEYNDPQAQQVVQHLIRAEMTKFAPSDDYISFLPAYEPTFPGHPRLQTEYRRVKANVPLNAIDLNRYQVREPTGKQAKDVAAWAAAVEKLQAAVEMQSDRVINLELQQAYAAKMWKVRAAVLDGMNAQVEKATTVVKEAADTINKERKQQQALNVPQLEAYKHKFNQLLEKNEAIKRACDALERKNNAKKLRTEDDPATA